MLGRMDSTENFAHLWNGSEPGWVVVRHTEDREKLQVVFAPSGPTMPEVKAIRSAVPALTDKATCEVLALLRGLPKFDLGDFESNAARTLRKKCEAVGLRVTSHAYQAVSDSLINELSKMYLLIEDDAKSKQVAEEAIKQGLPIRQSVA